MSSEAMARRVGGTNRRKKALVFSHVAESAQPFLVALLVEKVGPTTGNVWVVCETEREQERFHAELTTWLPEACVVPASRSRGHRRRGS